MTEIRGEETPGSTDPLSDDYDPKLKPNRLKSWTVSTGRGQDIDLADDDLVLIDDEQELERAITRLGKQYTTTHNPSEKLDIICQLIETGVKLRQEIPHINLSLAKLKARQEFRTETANSVIELARLRVDAVKKKCYYLKKTSRFDELAADRRELRLANQIPFHRELAEVICVMISEGQRVMGVCKQLDIKYQTIASWKKADQEFAEMYAAAKSASAEVNFDMAFTVLEDADPDDKSGVLQAKFLADVHMKYAALMDRNGFGTKTEVKHTGQVDHVQVLNTARKDVEKRRESILREINGDVVEILPATPSGNTTSTEDRKELQQIPNAGA